MGPRTAETGATGVTYLLVGTGVSATVHLDRGTILSLESSSTQRRSEPSGFLTKRMDEAAGLELGRTNPFSRFSFR